MNLAKQHQHVALNICFTDFCFFLFISVYCVFYMVSAQSYNFNKICVCATISGFPGKVHDSRLSAHVGSSCFSIQGLVP